MFFLAFRPSHSAGHSEEVVDTPQLVPLLLSSPSQHGLYLLVG